MMEENKDVKCGKCKSYKYPSQFLKNGRRLKTCNDCRLRCKESKERNKCEHGKQRSLCKDCGGGSICEHGKVRSRCKECDFKGYLSNIVRMRVYDALKHDKELSSKEYLGCDVDILKEHIEKQFVEGMNWDNYGEWHVDHIVPLKYNNPSLEEVCERLHYTNTQPLWATDNISKRNRYVG